MGHQDRMFARISTGGRLRIAIIEDDPDISAAVQQWLEASGHTCHVFPTARQAQREISRESFDLFVIDWQLPDFSGDQLLKYIRETLDHWVPAMFVTSRDSEEDIVTALRAGADDYMVKPVRRLELLARVEALLRRNVARSSAPVLEFAPYKLMQATRQVLLHGQPIELTEKEFELAAFFFKNMGQLVSRGHISETVWGRSEDVQSRTIDTHVSRLRKKLELTPENGFRLSPVYNFGYRLEQLSEGV